MASHVTKKYNTKRLSGTIYISGKGIGTFRHEEYENPIMINAGDTKNAFNQDTVLIELRGQQDKLEGVVINILERKKTTFVGTLTKKESGDFVVADNYRIHVPFHISSKKNANYDDKVLIKFSEWGENESHPSGEIIEIIGKKGLHETEMRSIVLDRGFATEFSKEIEEEAKQTKENSLKQWQEELSVRRDFRSVPTFTIDPIDAKDFDDAISIRKIDNKYEIGIHIADVSYFVVPGTKLDEEAKKRGTSIYLVDRTISMLPEILSNDLCSLNPNEEKLAFSAVFIIDDNGNISDRWFGKTVIKSARRFTYEEAEERIEKKMGDFAEEILILNRIAKRMLESRSKKGAISFETDEVKFILDENGFPIRIIRKIRKDSHKLVEEFMLLANREVALFVETLKSHKNDKAPLFLYRIHDIPDSEKIAELSIFVRALGHDLSIDGNITGKDLNALFARIEGEAGEGLVKTAAIRAMAKAIYSTKNIGHFGLAFDYYTHFTSPIRRYPDTVVHRLLDSYLNGKKVSDQEFSKYEKLASETTEAEIRASEAERESIKLKQVEYMSKRIGQTFNGKISGVTEWGIYVEDLETKSEGMVSLRSLKDDYYILDRKNYCLKGEKSKRIYSLGDKVKFKIVSANPEKRLLDYELIN